MLKFEVNNEEVYSKCKTQLEQIIDILQKHDKVNISIINSTPTSFKLSLPGHGKYKYTIKVYIEGKRVEEIKNRWFVSDVAIYLLNYKLLDLHDKIDFEISKEDAAAEELEKLMDARSYKRVNGALRQRG